MKRQINPDLTSRNYTYGCKSPWKAPVRNEEAAVQQLWLANRLWNVLVTIERVRVERYRRVMFNEKQARVGAINEEVGELRTAISKARQKARNRKDAKPETTPLQAQITPLLAERKVLLEELKATKEQRREAHKVELDREKEIYFKRIVRARQAAAGMGLFWGTYNNIIQRVDACRKLGDLHYKRFTGEGTLTTQIMGGMPTDSVIGGDHNFFQIDPPTEKQNWRYARLRIGSNPNRSPIWLELPIVYHRDLPRNDHQDVTKKVLIKSVSATRSLVAAKPGKIEWRLTITCTMPKPEAKSGSRAVAVDLGWRLMPNGVRVGYWHDGERGGEILVPMRDIENFQKVQSLRSICDLQRDEVIPMLASWLSGQRLDNEWQKRSGYLPQWRSTDRLARLVRWWADNRLPGDDEVFAAANAWKQRYWHLADYWRNLGDQMPLRIREQYRKFANQCSKNYDVLIIEDFNLTEVVEKPRPESDERKPLGSYRQMVSPSVLRGALVNAFEREGMAVDKEEAVGTTIPCYLCGDATPWDAAENVIHRCANGHIWDQDFNACQNLLKRWRARGKALAASEG